MFSCGKPVWDRVRGNAEIGGDEMTTNRFWGLRPIFVVLVVALLLPLACAQNANTGEIKGTVFDPSHAVVQGAKVVMTNVQTGVTTTTTTNSAGIYDVPSVP